MQHKALVFIETEQVSAVLCWLDMQSGLAPCSIYKDGFFYAHTSLHIYSENTSRLIFYRLVHPYDNRMAIG